MDRHGELYGMICAAPFGSDLRKAGSILQRDAVLMQEAMRKGLLMRANHIRIVGASEGWASDPVDDKDPEALSSFSSDEVIPPASAKQFARTISDLKNHLREEDQFVLYFSGHGSREGLLFADAAIRLDNLAAAIDRLPCRGKLLILDCCHSGSAEAGSPREMAFEESFAYFTGRGIAIMASSAPDEYSWADRKSGSSVYTGIVSAALCSRRIMRKGVLSLLDLQRETAFLMERWNRKHPDRAQHPFFRESMGGTLYFTIGDYRPYVPQKPEHQTERFTVAEVKPLDTASQRRLAAFVMTGKKAEPEELVSMAKEAYILVRMDPVYGNARMERIHFGKTAKSVWIYFAADKEDLLNKNYYAYAICAEGAEEQKRYFRSGHGFSVHDSVCLFQNSAYETVRELMKPQEEGKTWTAERKDLISRMVSLAEELAADIHRTENGEISFAELRELAVKKADQVTELFMTIENQPVSKEELHEWQEATAELAGSIMDLVLWMQLAPENQQEVPWLVCHKLDEYCMCLKKVAAVENAEY